MSLLVGVALVVAMASPKPVERTEPKGRPAPHDTVQAPPTRVAPPVQHVISPPVQHIISPPVQHIIVPPPMQRITPPVPHVVAQPVQPIDTKGVLPPIPRRVPVPVSPRRGGPAPTPSPAATQAPVVVNQTVNNYDDDRGYRGYYDSYGYNGYYNFGAYPNWNNWDTFYAWYPMLVSYGYLPQSYQVVDASVGARLLEAYKLQQTGCDQSGLVVMWWPDRTATCAYPNSLVAPGDYQIDTAYMTLTSIK